ncbi:hypothetical protein M413DRAFT_322893 [Hebeloma cylindrosporum]|uniref:Uncharacterized protein n=1 Tax=Hebeloma cylindrosporum TaxID=76867 RepID=A0A0C3BV69_HEBCY|nr:hypothetical protein M413DRAFT_322893 [Hebeloma cylindrosporum h7]
MEMIPHIYSEETQRSKCTSGIRSAARLDWKNLARSCSATYLLGFNRDYNALLSNSARRFGSFLPQCNVWDYIAL